MEKDKLNTKMLFRIEIPVNEAHEFSKAIAFRNEQIRWIKTKIHEQINSRFSQK